MSQPIIINEIENRLKLSGGTLTGSLFINNGYAYAAGNADESIFLSRRNSNDEKYSRYISISSKESVAIDSSITFVERNNDVWKTYKLYGEHNKPSAADVGAPSLTGEGATGEWNIDVSGSSNNANYVVKQDTRSINEAPIDMLTGLSIHLKGSNDGLDDGGSYHAAIHIKDWQDYSGGPFGQMAITGNQNFWFRVSSSGTTWGAWKKVLDGSNYTSYTVTKTGSGASGTWPISISGNAATASCLDNKFYAGRQKAPDASGVRVGFPPFIALALKNAGYGIYSDPEFSTGDCSVGVYNNSSNGTVTVTRTADSSAANSSGYIMRIKHTGSASPGFGGFVQGVTSRANAVFFQLFRAKIPVGYYVERASNSMGNSYNEYWITEQYGTGKWEWYGRITLCGESGTFSSGGHVYLNSHSGYPAPTSSAPITWDISYCNTFDLTKGHSINASFGTDYTTQRARNAAAYTSLVAPGNGETYLVYT